MSKQKKYWLISLAVFIAASFYPLYMGVRVISDMLTSGTVYAENYPKYIIPYTPVSAAVIVSAALMPLIIRYAKKYALVCASALGLAVFLLTEYLFESKVIVTTTVKTTLESWQMYSCYVPPEKFDSRTWTQVDVLMGQYSDTFKIHFYMISVILILTILNCLYGYASIIKTSDRKKLRALNIQAVCTALFLALCILACFTAFFRNGDIMVSPVSAVLMTAFFITIGVTSGIFAGSFLTGKTKLLSAVIPAVISSTVTLFMYIGEMFLLSTHLYRFGTSPFFTAIPGIVLAPFDILVIILSGVLTYLLCRMLTTVKNAMKT